MRTDATVYSSDILKEIQQLHESVNDDKIKLIRDVLIWLVGEEKTAEITIKPDTIVWVPLRLYEEHDLHNVPCIKSSLLIDPDQVIIVDHTDMQKEFLHNGVGYE